MQAMSNARVSPFSGVHLPSDVLALLSGADPGDVDQLFDQLRDVLTRPVVGHVVPQRALVATTNSVAGSNLRPPDARKRRVADPLAFGLRRVVLPFGLLLAGLVGLMALVG